MKVEYIRSDALPKAEGPYSHGTKCGNVILTSGQIPIDPATGRAVTDVKEATRLVLQNLLHVVEAGGGCLETVGRVDVYLKRLEDFQLFNESYTAFFGDHKPARCTVQAGDLAEDALLEATMIAFAID